MNQIDKKRSLIKYLETDDSGIALHIPFSAWGGSVSHLPASTLGAYSKIVDGVIRADSGDGIRKVLLIMQPDRYEPADSLLPEPTNVVVDDAWQKAMVFHQRRPGAVDAIHLGGHDGVEDAVQPYEPLFFCRQQDRWFHPVCPECGLPLTLCRDDNLLEQNDLPAYTNSLARYLTCHHCLVDGKPAQFYCLEKRPDDPSCVFDLNGLLDAWKGLANRDSDGAGWPCFACVEAERCYGNTEDAKLNIHPFAFYPFHLRITAAPDCNGETFIRMLGGDPSAVAVGSDQPDGRPTGSAFLFEDVQRRFFEILFLKLTFLSQISRQFMAESDADAPKIALALDGIGVDLVPVGIGLPKTWSFNTRIIDAVGSFRDAPFAPRQSRTSRFAFLGALWFRTLIVNQHQSAAKVFAHVGELTDPAEGTSALNSGVQALGLSDPIFGADQIFWRPQKAGLAGEGLTLWQTALHLGIELVKAGLDRHSDILADPKAFIEELDDLRHRSKDLLFATSIPADQRARAPVDSDRDAAGRRLHAVLGTILEKWQREAEEAARLRIPSAPPPVDSPTTFDTELEQTIAFQSPERPAAEPSDQIHARVGTSGPPPPSTDAPPSWNDDIEETVVLNSASTGRLPEDSVSPAIGSPAPSFSNFSDMDDEATVVLSGSPNGPVPPPEPEASTDNDQTILIRPAVPPDNVGLRQFDDELAATIHQHPPQPTTQPKDSAPLDRTGQRRSDDELAATIHQHAPPPENSAGGGWDDDLAETVVISSRPTQAPPVSSSPEKDDLAATVVQRQGTGSPPPAAAGIPPGQVPDDADEMAQTVVIDQGRIPPVAADTNDDALAETVIQSSAHTAPVVPQPPPANVGGQKPPPPPQPAPRPGSVESTTPDRPDDDDILEETIIIRSEPRKE